MRRDGIYKDGGFKNLLTPTGAGMLILSIFVVVALVAGIIWAFQNPAKFVEGIGNLILIVVGFFMILGAVGALFNFFNGRGNSRFN